MTTTSMTSMTSAGPETAATTDPLGPDSLTWKYFGDLRTG
ncbi:MAG: oxygenase MpaB family protein, partial [Mycobacterium sp.]